MTGAGRALTDPAASIPPAHRAALRRLHERLTADGLRWAVTGSLGFALQGMPVAVRDIDIQTDRDGAYRIAALFAASVTLPVAYRADERIRSHFGTLALDDVAVEIMGAVQKRLADSAWEDPVDIAHHRQFVAFEGLRVPVLSLAYECQAYRRLGRLEKAALLERWLRDRGTPIPAVAER